MAKKVVQLNRIGTVTFNRNNRSKNIKISVKPDNSVLVSYPFFVSSKEVTAFVARSEKWILQQQQKVKTSRDDIFEGKEINTKMHRLIFYRGEQFHAKNSDSTIQVFAPEFNSERAHNFFENILVQVYRFEAHKILGPRLAELASKNEFHFERVTIRNNKRNWGSCSSRNNISLNLQMMKLPDELIDYILLHELVHTEIKNHGPEFWKRLDQLTGGRARELALQVKKYSTYTL